MGAVEELGYAYNEENILVEPEAKNTLPAIMPVCKQASSDKDKKIQNFICKS